MHSIVSSGLYVVWGKVHFLTSASMNSKSTPTFSLRSIINNNVHAYPCEWMIEDSFIRFPVFFKYERRERRNSRITCWKLPTFHGSVPHRTVRNGKGVPFYVARCLSFILDCVCQYNVLYRTVPFYSGCSWWLIQDSCYRYMLFHCTLSTKREQ